MDIRFTWPDGARYRERVKSPVTGKSASLRWGVEREGVLLRAGKSALIAPPKPKEVPTLEEFWPRFIDGYCRANRQKPSGIESKESIYRAHLGSFRGRRLDSFTNEDVQRIKASLIKRSPKTVNNVLTTLSSCLKTAVEWEVIDEVPCRLRLLKVSQDVPGWYEILEYQRLVDAARKIDPRIEIMVLLAGDAGLRRGEIMALGWTDIDLGRGLLNVRRSVWCGHETETKGFRSRIVPTTEALREALSAHRHLRGPRVLYADDGRELTNKVVRKWMEKAQKRGGLVVTGAIHRLRHTFCSMLATKGAAPKAIQELAGHQSIATTMRYMHLSPATRESAVRLLDQARREMQASPGRGDGVETGENRA